MKKNVVSVWCLVLSVTLLLCSCGRAEDGANTTPSVSVLGKSDSETTALPAASEFTTTTAPMQSESKPETTTQPVESEPTTTKHIHEWGEWYLTKLANPNEQGNDRRVCSTCGAVQNHAFDWSRPSGSWFWNAENHKNALNDKVSFQPRLAYWQNNNLYIDYFIVNLTGGTRTVKGIKELTISYRNPTTGEKTLIAKVTNFVFGTPITIENGQHQEDALYLCIGTDDIVTFDCNLEYLSCAWEFDLA